MTFAEWNDTVAMPAIKKIERRNKRAAFRSSKAGKILKAVVKEAGLLAVMAAVTTVVVFFETGDIHKAIHIASVAGPIKATAAALYSKVWS